MSDESGIEEVNKSTSISKQVMDDLGFMNQEHFDIYWADACSGMMQLGDNFSKALGSALCIASEKDAIRLIYSFKVEVEHYVMLWRIKQAIDKANQAVIK